MSLRLKKPASTFYQPAGSPELLPSLARVAGDRRSCQISTSFSGPVVVCCFVLIPKVQNQKPVRQHITEAVSIILLLKFRLS
jgi:hypothetical protein